MPAGRARLRQADLRPETVYITPLCRTRQTAEVLFPGARLVEVKDLQEMCFGSFEAAISLRWSTTRIICLGERQLRKPLPGRRDQGCFFGAGVQGLCRTGGQGLAEGKETLVILAHGGTQMAAMERYALPHADYYHWCAPNAGGYVLDAGDWAEQRVLHLLKTVQYTKEDAR